MVVKYKINMKVINRQYFLKTFSILNLTISVTEIKNANQFREIFPIFISIGSYNDLVTWSTNKDIFRVEERQWKGNWEGEAVVVKIDKKMSVFWIGYDGDYIVVLSNNKLLYL